MAAPVGSLVVRVGSDIRGLTGGMKRGTREVKRFGTQTTRIGKASQRAFQNLGGSVTRVVKAMTSLRAIGAAFVGAQVVRGLSSIVTSSIELGDKFSKLNTRLGLTVEFLSDMRFAAERTGVGFDTLTMGFQRVIRRMEEFRQTGKGPAAEGFKSLGDGIADAVKRGESFESLLPRIADGFVRLESDQLRVLTAMRLFDSEGVKLVQLFKDGSDGIAALRDESKKLGARWTQLAADDAARMQDALTDLKTRARSLADQLAITFGPPALTVIEKWSEAFAEAARLGFRGQSILPPVLGPGIPTGAPRAIQEARAAADAMAEAMAEAGESMRPFFSGFGQVFLKPEFIAGAEELLNVTERIEQKFAELASNATRFSEIVQRGSGFGALQEGFSRQEDERKEALELRIEAIRQALLTERELEVVAFEQRMEDLREGLQLEGAVEEEFRKLRERAQDEHSGRIIAIKKDEADALVNINKAAWEEQAAAVASNLAQISGFLASGLQTAFGESKAAAIASGILNTIEAAANSYTWGARIGGPPLGAVMAAIAAGAQLARLAQIRSTTFRGGGGGAAAPAPAAAAAPVQPASISNVSISLVGDRFSREQVRDLIHEVNEALADGARLNVR